jgi:replication-associated recombination protein RarA
MSPASFKPLEPDDLIGSAGLAARALVAKAKRVRSGRDGSIKVLLYGPPGVGKTTMDQLAGKILQFLDLGVRLQG